MSALKILCFHRICTRKRGRVHISNIANRRINHVEDELTLGDKVKVICLGKDKMGRISFSIKDVPEE